MYDRAAIMVRALASARQARASGSPLSWQALVADALGSAPGCDIRLSDEQEVRGLDLSSIREVDGLGGEPVLRDHLPLRGIELRERARPVADEADVIGPGRKVRHGIAIRLGAGEQEYVDAGAANEEVGLAATVEGVVAAPSQQEVHPGRT